VADRTGSSSSTTDAPSRRAVPDEVWQAPATAFVQGFLGDVNTFRGRADRGRWRADGPDVEAPEFGESRDRGRRGVCPTASARGGASGASCPAASPCRLSRIVPVGATARLHLTRIDDGSPLEAEVDALWGPDGGMAARRPALRPGRAQRRCSRPPSTDPTPGCAEPTSATLPGRRLECPMNDEIRTTLDRAARRGADRRLPYAGLLTPAEAWALHQARRRHHRRRAHRTRVALRRPHPDDLNMSSGVPMAPPTPTPPSSRSWPRPRPATAW
jgi:hypothetical protein